MYSGPPVINSLEYGVNSAGLYVITCTTTRSPPTAVTWTRNGVLIEHNDGRYKSSQTIVNRSGTVYENKLTIDGSFEDAVGDYSCTAENLSLIHI